MEPLITNGIDPALLRVIEKRGQERDPEMRRRRAGTKPARVSEASEQENGGGDLERDDVDRERDGQDGEKNRGNRDGGDGNDSVILRHTVDDLA
jgi:hypothetical protein